MTALRSFIDQEKGTASALARRLGVSPSTIHRIACGERMPSIALAQRISEVTGISVADLLPDVARVFISEPSV